MPAVTQLYTKRAQVYVTEESALDTVETMLVGDAFLAEIPDSPLSIQGDNYQPTTVRGDFLSQDEVPGVASAQISFRVPVKGSTAAGVIPEYADALLACGMREVLVVGASATYFPFSTFDGNVDAVGPPIFRNPFGSSTVTVLEAGIQYRIKGAAGNLVFTGNIGEPLFAEFTFTGAYVAPADIALLAPTYDVTNPNLFAGASFSINQSGAYTPKGVSNFTLDLGNNVIPVNDINDSSGIYGARITGRKSFGSFDPEAQTKTVIVAGDPTDWWWGEWRDTAQSGSITTGAIGSVAGNVYTMTVARCRYRTPELSNNDGIRKMLIPFAVSSAGGDVEGTNQDVTLAFT